MTPSERLPDRSGSTPPAQADVSGAEGLSGRSTRSVAGPGVCANGNAIPDEPWSLLDFNENPLGPPAAAVARVAANLHTLHRYPRGLEDETQAAIASHIGADLGEVLVVGGIDEASDLLLLHARKAWTLIPGFPGFWARAEALDVPCVRLAVDVDAALRREDDWTPSLPREVAEGGVVLLARPDNPLGAVHPTDWLEEALERAPLLLVDESYLDFGGIPSVLDRWKGRPNLCVFKSFSKAFGLASLRLGALVGPADLVARLRRQRRFLPVDSIALHAVLGCLEDIAAVEEAVGRIRTWRSAYARSLGQLDDVFEQVVETPCNFVLAKCRQPSSGVVDAALAGGVQVTACEPFGLPGWVRVSVGTPTELSRLCRALRGATAVSRTVRTRSDG